MPAGSCAAAVSHPAVSRTVPLANIVRELRQYQTAGCEHVALEVSYSTYPAILETIDIIAEEIRPALEQQRER